MSDQIDYDKINQRVAQRMKQRKDFQGAVLSFFIISGITWTIYLTAEHRDPFAWPLIPMIILGIIALSKAIETYYLADAREREQENLYQRELDRERARVYGDAALEKPKRDQNVRLSDEGELIYDEEDEYPERRASAGRS